eukprot:scaffold283679_cov23-Tisochrysis_lutea.AAC.1
MSSRMLRKLLARKNCRGQQDIEEVAGQKTLQVRKWAQKISTVYSRMLGKVLTREDCSIGNEHGSQQDVEEVAGQVVIQFKEAGKGAPSALMQLHEPSEGGHFGGHVGAWRSGTLEGTLEHGGVARWRAHWSMEGRHCHAGSMTCITPCRLILGLPSISSSAQLCLAHQQKITRGKRSTKCKNTRQLCTGIGKGGASARARVLSTPCLLASIDNSYLARGKALVRVEIKGQGTEQNERAALGAAWTLPVIFAFQHAIEGESGLQCRRHACLSLAPITKCCLARGKALKREMELMPWSLSSPGRPATLAEVFSVLRLAVPRQAIAKASLDVTDPQLAQQWTGKADTHTHTRTALPDVQAATPSSLRAQHAMHLYTRAMQPPITADLRQEAAPRASAHTPLHPLHPCTFACGFKGTTEHLPHLQCQHVHVHSSFHACDCTTEHCLTCSVSMSTCTGAPKARTRKKSSAGMYMSPEAPLVTPHRPSAPLAPRHTNNTCTSGGYFEFAGGDQVSTSGSSLCSAPRQQSQVLPGVHEGTGEALKARSDAIPRWGTASSLVWVSCVPHSVRVMSSWLSQERTHDI